MEPFSYHDGQRDVQREANSVKCADKLATWVGPVPEFARLADLIVLAHLGEQGFDVAGISGPPPLVDLVPTEEAITLRLPQDVETRLSVDGMIGGIVINPAQARRSRVAGRLVSVGGRLELRCQVGFTNCRKYMTPTTSTGTTSLVGPARRDQLAVDDEAVSAALATAETAFLVTATPDGVADVSHRGGPPGFLRWAPIPRQLEWTEYLGDGMFVSVGNLRRRNRFALLVLDFATGDAIRLDGVARYTNIRTDRKERVDALIQAGEPFAVQGRVTATVERAERLSGFCHPRERAPARQRITSTDTTEVQHPQ